MTTLWITRAADGTVLVSSDGDRREAPAADVDAALLNVGGGVLYWNVLDPSGTAPIAILDDPDTAQDWLWAVYGESVAVAVADVAAAAVTVDEASDPAVTDPLAVDAAPALPDLAATAARLAYAHWAVAWWPASDIDDIPPLDRRLLDAEIAELSAECEPLWSDDATDGDPIDAATVPGAHVTPATRFALAAGTEAVSRGLPLAEGTTGTDWRRYPAGLIDASEQAVSWRLWRAAATTTVEVSVAAAPDLTAAPPPWLRPHAEVTGGHSELAYDGEAWNGLAPLPDADRTDVTVTVYLPDYAAPPTGDTAAATALRHRIRDLARHRLARADGSGDGLLRAELAAAAASDF